jgi:hypothetical protein
MAKLVYWRVSLRELYETRLEMSLGIGISCLHTRLN